MQDVFRFLDEGSGFSIGQLDYDILDELDDELDDELLPRRKKRQQFFLPFTVQTIALATLHQNACNPVLRASARAILER